MAESDLGMVLMQFAHARCDECRLDTNDCKCPEVFTCNYCQSEFVPKPWQVKRPDRCCRDCHNKYNREYTRKRRESGNPVDKRELESQYRLKFPEKYKAHFLFHAALRRGDLVRPKKCSHCKEEVFIEAHHPDYSKPLEVRWLCRLCHADMHPRS